MAVEFEVDSQSVVLDDLPGLLGTFERAAAELALAVAHIDQSGVWGHDGSATSMTAWLRANCRMSRRDAAGWVRRGRFLARFDDIAEAATSGVLAAGHVDAIRQVVNPTTEPVMAEQQSAVVAAIAPLDVREAEVACRHWKAMAESIADDTEPTPPRRELTFATASDGAVVGRFDLDGAVGAEFVKAIETALTWNGNDEFRLPAHQRADALFEVCAFFNAHHDRAGTPRHRAHVELTLTLDQATAHGAAETVDGAVLGSGATSAFLCDSVIHRVVRAPSAILDYGRATRSVPVDLFRAVAQRDRGCRYPGCDRKVSWCEAHHVVHWRHGGPTELGNLVLLCSRHHHQIHEPGWHVTLAPDGELRCTTPSGLIRSSRPPGHAPPGVEIPLPAVAA